MNIRATICLLGIVSAGASAADNFVIHDSDEWIPLGYRKTINRGSALDFSTQPYFHTPAGKFGRVVSRNGRFELEQRPGVPQRLYGVNLCADACLPDHELADEVAVRLARTGYNSVRIHHHDSYITTEANGRTELDAEKMERLDYFLAALIRNGLYITTDLFVSRQPVKWRDLGIDWDGDAEKYAQKALMTFYPPAYSNWCAYTRAFLTHRNPHTGRSLAEEPALACLVLVNEGRFVYPYHDLPKTKPFKQKWKEWISARRAKDPNCYPELKDISKYPKIQWRDQKGNIPRAIADFSADLDREFVRRAKAFLRDELKCPVLVSNQNNAAPYIALNAAREEVYDYTDMHFYRGTPKGGGPKQNKPPFTYGHDNLFKPLGDSLVCYPFLRLHDKPFTVSELNFPAPNPYRGAGGLKTGALSALQDWSAIWRFAYSHSERNLRENKYGASRFDVSVDLINLASERIAFTLFLRGDLAPAKDAFALVMDEASLNPPSGPDLEMYAPWTNAVWSTRFGSCLPSTLPKGMRSMSVAESKRTPEFPVKPAPVPGVSIDPERGSLVIATPKTAGGFVPSGRLTAGPLEADVAEEPTTVWVSSLDGKEITASSRLLLTRLVDTQYRNATYADATREVLLDKGLAYRALVKNADTRIRLKLKDPAAYDIHVIDSAGKRVGRVDATIDGDALAFVFATRGPKNQASIAYEIVRK